MGYMVGDEVVFYRCGKWLRGIVDETTSEGIFIKCNQLSHRWVIDEHEGGLIELWQRAK